MLRKYMEIEKTGAELGEASVQYYNKLQEYINHLNKYLLMVSPDTESNKDILAKARSLMLLIIYSFSKFAVYLTCYFLIVLVNTLVTVF